MRIKETSIQKITEAQVIIDVVKSYQDTTEAREGKDFKTTSEPQLILNTNKPGTAFAYKEQQGYNCISYLMTFQGKTYPEALLEVARIANITVEYANETKLPSSPKPKKGKPATTRSFCDTKLLESGMKASEHKALIKDNVNGKDVKKEIDVFTPGTIRDWDFSSVKPGDDLIIHYFDLEGEPVKVRRKNKQGNFVGKEFPFVRIRHKNPDLHKLNGKATKYLSPPGTGSQVYIPQVTRKLYQEKRKIETLWIQEGEIKSECASKHGLISVGVGGVTSLVTKQGLAYEFAMLVKECNVNNVVFVVDSDYLDLGSSTKEAVNRRPEIFFKAVQKFQKWFYAFVNEDIHLKIYFGYINGNTHKGIDDLFVAHKGKETEIVADVKKTLNEPKGEGEFLNIHNITNISEFNLRKKFKLESRASFFSHHKIELKTRQYFTYFKQRWRWNDEKEDFDLNQPVQEEEKWYRETKRGEKTKFDLDPERLTMFLQNRGFHRYRESLKKPQIFISQSDGIVKEVTSSDIKDFVFDFAREAIGNIDVVNMLHYSQTRFLSDTGFSNLSHAFPKFHQNTKENQYYYFAQNIIKITKNDIELIDYKQLNGSVWSERISKKNFELTEVPFYAEKDENGEIKFFIYDDAKECEFFQYLYDTSNFYHRKKETDLKTSERNEIQHHILNKITGLGYLLHTYFNPANAKMVISIDGRESEIGMNNGRTGKSIFGHALGEIVPMEIIEGKRYERENYPFENVTSRTPIVNIDDPRERFDIESFFSSMTGNFVVEPKGKAKFTIPRENTPKIYVSTNHGVKVNGASERARTFFMAFSDYYNENFSPENKFGHLFFTEWTDHQYNLFLNTCFRAVQVYLNIGLQKAPGMDVKIRSLRAEMGEAFLDWAEKYFHEEIQDPLSTSKYIRLGKRLTREEIHTDYTNTVRIYLKSKQRFKIALLAYCEYKGYKFNPGCKMIDSKTKGITAPDGGYDKTGGIEYFTIAKGIEV